MISRFTIPERLLRRLHLLPTPIMDSFGSVLYGRSLAIAVRAGFFEAIQAKPLQVSDIAAVSGLHPSAVHMLAEAFVEGGYCRRHGSAYGLSVEGRKWLLKSSPSSLVYLIRYFETLQTRWGNLEGSFRAGRPVTPYYASFGPADWEVYVLGMRELARLVMPAVMRKVRIPSNATRLLDVGGSHGEFAFECCRRFPRLAATVADFPQPLQWAAGFAREAGLEQRVEFLPGDFLNGQLPGNQDIILLYNVVHGLTVEQNQNLISTLLDALRKGGRIYVLDQLIIAGQTSSLARFMPLMVGLNLLNEIGGQAYSYTEVERWVAGVTSVQLRKLGIPGISLVEIVK